MTDESSYKVILKSSSLMGAASAVNIAAGLIRVKILALSIGPSGVGLLGIYQSFVQTGTILASMGLGTSGVRQIASAYVSNDVDALRRARYGLLWGTWLMAILAGIAFWLGRGFIAEYFLGSYDRKEEIGWLSIALVLSVAAISQGAVLQGLRKIESLAKLSALGGVIGSFLGILGVLIWPENGALLMILSATLTTYILGYWYVACVRLPETNGASFIQNFRDFGQMARMGLPFMLSMLLIPLSQLAIRAMVQQDLGVEALGHFQAAWAIGNLYLSFVLTAMTSDYYPRLTAAIGDPQLAGKLINEQTEVALMLCTPVIIALLGSASFVVQILYSGDFLPAASILICFLIGDILKILSWPLGFVFGAKGDGNLFFWTEFFLVIVLLSGIYFGLPLFGLDITGYSYITAYFLYFLMVFLLIKRDIKFNWSRSVINKIILISVSTLLLLAVSKVSTLYSCIIGCLLALIFSYYSIKKLLSKSGFNDSEFIGNFARRIGLR